MYDISGSEFSKRLRKSIENKGITQIDLAKQLGISKTALNNYVQGKLPTVPILYALSVRLSVSSDWLLSGTLGEAGSLGEMERRLLEMYRDLDRRDQQDIWETTQLKFNRTIKKDSLEDSDSGETA